MILNKSAAAGLFAGGIMALAGTAHAQSVVASWIQMGPGSSPHALANGSYGDVPASLTPTILARAVITGGSCPAVTLNGGSQISMTQRFVGSQLTSTPGNTGATNASTAVGGTYPQYFVSGTADNAANFADGTAKATKSWAECEAVIPAGYSTATIAGTTLKLPVANPQRILVIADTGCRMAAGSQQNCHSPSGFPFAALSNFEATFKPDLIVHIGDYFYRDTNCIPTTNSAANNGNPATTAGVEQVTGCSNPANAAYETWGDTFDSWNADFLYPGQTLLATAPWVMARGNHESCGRGARGWFALLDPHPFALSQVTCALNAGKATVNNAAVYSGDFTPTYAVPAGLVNLLVHDSSFANDSLVDVNMAKNFDYDLTSLLTALPASAHYAYVTHKPAFGMTSGATTNSGDFTEQYTFTGAPIGSGSAFTGGVPLKIAMMLSGHIHQFEYVNFSDYTHYAPQIVVGTGGSSIDPSSNPQGFTAPGGLTYGYTSTQFTVHNTPVTATTTTATVKQAYSQAEFGFALLDANAAGGYTASVYNINAAKAGRCTVTLGNVTGSPRGITCWN